MNKTVLGLLLVSSLLAFGCSKKDEGTATEQTAATGDKIGVTECDDYLTKMQACLDKMPAAARAVSESAMKQQREAWKAAAASPGAKDGIKSACKASLDALASNPACK